MVNPEGSEPEIIEYVIESPSTSVADAFAVLPLNAGPPLKMVAKLVSADWAKVGGWLQSIALDNVAARPEPFVTLIAVSYTHLRAHET